MLEKSLSPHILEQLPRYIIGDYQKFADFLQAYFEWLEQDSNVYNVATEYLDYRDIDKTLTEFVRYFEKEYLINIPSKLYSENGTSVDKATVLKHIKQFYQSRGSEKSFKLLFRILFNEDVQFYYPKVDMLYVSDGKWAYDKILRCTSTNDVFQFIGKKITGVSSGATAAVENVFQYQQGADLITELYVSNIIGEFQASEDISCFIGEDIVTETLFNLVTGIVINDPGFNYKVGNLVVLSGNGTGAEAIVEKVKGVISSNIQVIDGGYGYIDVPDTKIYGTGFDAKVTSNLKPTGIYKVDIINSGTGYDINFPPTVHFLPEELTLTLTTTTGNFITATRLRGVVSEAIGTIESVDFNLNYVITLKNLTDEFQIGETVVAQHLVSGVWVDLADGGVISDMSPFTATATATVNTSGSISRIDILNAGAFYKKPPTIRLKRQTGEWDDYSVLKAYLLPTIVESITVTNSGRDYTSDAEISVVFSGGLINEENARHAVASAEISGQIVDISITNPGINYTIPPNVVFSYATGTGAVATAQIGPLFTYPGRYLNNDGFVSADKYIQDSFYYQVYSYVLKSTLGFTQYEDVVHNVLHPAGLLLFGTTILSSLVQLGPTYSSFEGEKNLYQPTTGFSQSWPAPNNSYWSGGIANTQTKDWMNVVTGDVIGNPLTRINNAPDVFLNIYNPVYNIPTAMVEYDFIQGLNDQVLYDITPSPEYDGILGSQSGVDINDPVWVSYGLKFNGTYVNCSSVPVNPLEQTVIVVAKIDELSTPASIIGCIDSDNDTLCTGYSIDIDVTRKIRFRSQKRTSTNQTYDLNLQYPDSTDFELGQWFLCVLRYKNNTLYGNLNNKSTINVQYPVDVESLGINNNTKGYYIGNQGFVKPMTGGSFYSGCFYGGALYGSGANVQITYVSVPSYWNQSQFNETYFDGSNTTNVVFVQPVPGRPLLNGIVAYTLIYDRILLDEEVEIVYTSLKSTLLSRQITIS